MENVSFHPTVSIVIGVYNGADKIGKCLQSMLDQTYPKDAYDVIVVENGSTDNTIEVVKQYPVRLYQSEVRGLARARNLGIAQSSAEIIVTTDADCYADPNWLAELTLPYQDPQVGGVGGAILAYKSGERNNIEQFSEDYSPLVNFQSGDNEFLPRLCGAHASYRREDILHIGGYTPWMITGEDVDIAWRIQLQTGKKLVYAPKAVIYHHHRSTRAGLARQYRQYGFGEILLDTMFKDYPGYPRTRAFQFKRILGQITVLPKYILSAMKRSILYRQGRIDSYQASIPGLWYLIERRNIRGKIEGMLATNWMTGYQKVQNQDIDATIATFYGGEKKSKHRKSIEKAG